MNPEKPDSLELEEDTTLPEADKASALANPKIRLAVLALALVVTIGTLWAGISTIATPELLPNVTLRSQKR